MLTISATPVALLAAWEAAATPAQVAAQLPRQPSVLAWLTQVAAFPHSDVNVNLDDARTVLHGARAIRAAQASARGEDRIAAVLRQLLAGLPTGRLAQRSLLSILSSPVHERAKRINRNYLRYAAGQSGRTDFRPRQPARTDTGRNSGVATDGV